MVSKRKKNHLKSPLLFLGVIFLGGWRGVVFFFGCLCILVFIHLLIRDLEKVNQ